jgi:hypothetical protein
VQFAYREIGTVLSILSSARDDSRREFNRIFKETTKLGKDLHGQDYELRKPIL